MKLNLGNNIRKHRREMGLTQEQFADKIGVSPQAISRWENGTTYPDMELIPVLANTFGITTDILFDMCQSQKEAEAKKNLTELARLSYEKPLNVDRIIELIREIRRNYIGCDEFWTFWLDVNQNIYRDERILPEVRSTFDAIMNGNNSLEEKMQAVKQFIVIEDEEHIEDIMNEYATESDMSKNQLYHHRYRMRNDVEKDSIYRQKILFQYLSELIGCSDLWGEFHRESDELLDLYITMLHKLCQCIPDENHPISGNGKVDVWVYERLYIGIRKAERLTVSGDKESAFVVLNDIVSLLEETMRITNTTLTPSSPWMKDIVWVAEEHNTFSGNSYLLSKGEERQIWLHDSEGYCYWISPSWFCSFLSNSEFDSIRDDPRYVALSDRVKALIKISKNEN